MRDGSKETDTEIEKKRRGEEVGRKQRDKYKEKRKIFFFLFFHSLQVDHYGDG